MGALIAGVGLLALAHVQVVPGLTTGPWHPVIAGAVALGLATWIAAVVLEMTAAAPERQPRWVAGSLITFIVAWKLMPAIGKGPWFAYLAAASLGLLPALWAAPEPGPDTPRPDRGRLAALVGAAAWFTFLGLVVGCLTQPAYLDERKEATPKAVEHTCGVSDQEAHGRLHHAIISHNVTKAMELVHAEPRLARCHDGPTTPLQTALETGDGPMVVGLAERGADTNYTAREDRMAPLHVAAQHMDGWVVWNLIRRGARPNVVDAEGRTPLSIARARRDDKAAKVIEVLEGAGAR